MIRSLESLTRSLIENTASDAELQTAEVPAGQYDRDILIMDADGNRLASVATARSASMTLTAPAGIMAGGYPEGWRADRNPRHAFHPVNDLAQARRAVAALVAWCKEGAS